MTLNEKTIAVTGVASGIGAATASALKAAGARVVGFDRNEPSVEIDAFYRIDLSDPASIDQAAAVLDGEVDGLCNIAGLPPTLPADLVLKVNFWGLRRLTEALAPKLNPGASIVNVASLAGLGWRDNIALLKEGFALQDFDGVEVWRARHEIDGARAYNLSKELVIAWTIANSERWRGQGIRMNVVSPGPVDTPILADFIETLGKRAEEDLKLNRAGQTDEIASAIVFLCSYESRWVNGTNIAADGGAEANALRQIYGLSAD